MAGHCVRSRESEHKYSKADLQHSQADYENEIFQHQVRTIDAYLLLLIYQKLVQIQQSNPERAQMFKRLVDRTGKTMFVPTTSVVSSSEKMFVIKVNENRAQWVSVQKGNVLDSLVEVFGDVQPGMTIVKKASEEIRDGQEIKAVK